MCVHRGVSLNLRVVWSDSNAFWSQFMLEIWLWRHRGLLGCFFPCSSFHGMGISLYSHPLDYRDVTMAATVVLELRGARCPLGRLLNMYIPRYPLQRFGF